MLATAAAAWEDLQAKSCTGTMLGTAAAAWEDLQAKSCAGIMIILNITLLYTF
jgi:hypothetical protein